MPGGALKAAPVNGDYFSIQELGTPLTHVLKYSSYTLPNAQKVPFVLTTDDDHRLRVEAIFSGGGSFPISLVTSPTTAAETAPTGVSGTALAANAPRKRAWIQNVSSLYVRLKLGAGATTSSAIRLVPQVGTYVVEMTPAGNIYQGVISFISETGGSVTLAVVEEV